MSTFLNNYFLEKFNITFISFKWVIRAYISTFLLGGFAKPLHLVILNSFQNLR